MYALRVEDIPEDMRTIERFQNESNIMVWATVSKKDKFLLVFVEKV